MATVTMKKVQYIGESTNLSRFGRVKKGDKLDFYEKEWDAICKDKAKNKKRYKELSEPISKDERLIAEKIKPLGTPKFDLRSVPWEHRNLISILESRMSKARLVKMVYAINAIGGIISESTVHDTRAMLVDRIVEAARIMGWDKLTKVERLALPKWDGKPPKNMDSSSGRKRQPTKKTSTKKKPKTKALRSRRVSK